MSRSQPSVPSIFALGCLLLGACHGSVVVHDDDPPVFSELEPNDHAWQAPLLGGIEPGDHFFVEGSLSTLDVQDGLSFVAEEPCRIDFALEAYAPTDLDVWLYDPLTDEIVASFSSPYDPEVGTLYINGYGVPFHLVVVPAFGSANADYTLEIRALYLSATANVAAERALVPHGDVERMPGPSLRAYPRRTRQEEPEREPALPIGTLFLIAPERTLAIEIAVGVSGFVARRGWSLDTPESPAR
jgi:hypothetical protein